MALSTPLTRYIAFHSDSSSQHLLRPSSSPKLLHQRRRRTCSRGHPADEKIIYTTYLSLTISILAKEISCILL
uniref:Ovule protein n=1 Tax=Ascaris lumbricoides TaxID=6252 RepID=A0A0M3HMQ2_ASCLU